MQLNVKPLSYEALIAVNLIGKVVLLSTVIALLIKFVAPLLPISSTTAIVLLIVVTPSVATASYLGMLGRQ